MAVWSTLNLSKIDLADRIDAEYFQPSFLKAATTLEGTGKRLKDLSKLVCSAFYPPATQLYETGDIPFIRCVDVISYPIITNNQPFERIPKAFIEANHTVRTVKTGDIVITKVGTPCYAGLIHENLEYAALTRTVLGVTDIKEELVDPYYLVVFLRSTFGYYQLMREREQQIQLQLTLERVGKINVYLPSLEIQKEVGDMLRRYYSLLKESQDLSKTAEILLLDNLKSNNVNLSHQVNYVANFSETWDGHRLDAEYFQPKYYKITKHLSTNYPVETIEQWNKVLKGKSINRYLETGVPVIRSGDLDDLDNLRTEEMKYADPNEGLFYLHKGDICISSIGFGSIGKIQVFDKNSSFATVSEVTVIRQKKVNPYYLQVFLQSPLGQLQIERRITGATGQLHLYPRDVGSIIVPILPTEVQKEFENIIMKSRRLKIDARFLLENAKLRVDNLIENAE